MDKYLSVITNFGCHGRCPYCIVRENGIKVPKSTVDGLDKLEDAITLTGANIVSISGGGDPLYRYSDNPLVPMYLAWLWGSALKPVFQWKCTRATQSRSFRTISAKEWCIICNLLKIWNVWRDTERKS